jgi:hypothetical protein
MVSIGLQDDGLQEEATFILSPRDRSVNGDDAFAQGRAR